MKITTTTSTARKRTVTAGRLSATMIRYFTQMLTLKQITLRMRRKSKMKQTVSYLELAKEAKSRGDIKGVWRAFRQHARVMKKQRAAMAGTVVAQVQK